MKPYLLAHEDALAEVKSQRAGLSAAEAEKRFREHGGNKLIEAKKESVFRRLLMQLADPMIIILIAAAVISGITAHFEGESMADVFIILIVVVVNSVLGVYRESKAEKAIEALRDMAAATSKVMRGGVMTVVKSEELVVGDIVLLDAGDSVPADGRIIECASMKIEEAALTGESVPVTKTDKTLTPENGQVPLGDRKNMVFMGSAVVYGRGMFVVTGTGMQTEMGKIADALANAKEGKTPLQIQLAKLSKILTVLVLAVCVVIFGVGILKNGGFSGGHILDSFMVAVSLAVAAIPEGLVAVITIVLSIGVTNMSRRNAIVRRLTAVETLGCAQIICSDKTGTLTQNKMTVVESFGGNDPLLAGAMSLCSDAELTESGDVLGEPTECALVAWAAKLDLKKPALKEQFPRIGEAPFDSERKMMSTVHGAGGKIVQYTKGAPDELLKRCNRYLNGKEVLPLTDEKRDEILAGNKNMADRALRVLAAAYKEYDKAPDMYEPETLECGLIFVGLTGMIDPVRPEVKDAIIKCADAGITPIMITGDHVDTAVAIASELGILTETAAAITGAQLDLMDDDEYRSKFKSISVYARVQPEHKVRIVNAWREAGYVTAMTGDGVNDAPSIKSADIGVGMGITGTDVTKNVADIVLTDDNFATIVGAVEEGRRIYDNIRKAIQFLLSSNISEVISIFAATLMGFVILKPVHLLWINLVTDCFPALALGMESAEGDIMTRHARSPKESVFSGGVGAAVIYQGILIACLTMAAYFIGHFLESGAWEVTGSAAGMTMAFLTMSMSEVFHSLNMRSLHGSMFAMRSVNRMLNIAAIASFAATTLVIYVPFLSKAFGFSHIGLGEYAISLLLAVSVIPIVELIKLIQRKLGKAGK